MYQNLVHAYIVYGQGRSVGAPTTYTPPTPLLAAIPTGPSAIKNNAVGTVTDKDFHNSPPTVPISQASELLLSGRVYVYHNKGNRE